MANEISEHKSGDEIGGRKIRDIVGRNRDFVIFTVEDEKGTGVQWSTRERFAFTDAQRAQIAEFNARYDAVTTAFPRSLSHLESLALALYNALCAPKQGGEAAFGGIDELIAEAREKASSRTRLVYGIAATLTASMALLLLLGVDIREVLASDNKTVTAPAVIVSAIAGAVGALASTLQKLHRLEVLKYPGLKEAAFAGASRILLGMIFGAAGYSGAQAELILTILLKSSAGILLIGFAAGISERLIPEMISGLESGKSNKPSRIKAGKSLKARA